MKMNVRVSLLILFVCRSVCAREPQCSPFHYEEKTLEKMIKTEIFVEKMKSELDERDKIMKEMLEKMQEDWKTTKSDIVTAMDKNEETIKEIITEFETIKDDVQVPVIAFSAHELQNLEPSEKEALIFTTTNFDIGSGYNNKTGVYTAPVSGVYLFTCQLCISNNKYLHVELESGDKTIVNMLMDDSRYGTCRRMTGISILKANEQARIKAGSSSSGPDMWQYKGSPMSIFSGVLINISR